MPGLSRGCPELRGVSNRCGAAQESHATGKEPLERVMHFDGGSGRRSGSFPGGTLGNYTLVERSRVIRGAAGTTGSTSQNGMRPGKGRGSGAPRVLAGPRKASAKRPFPLPRESRRRQHDVLRDALRPARTRGAPRAALHPRRSIRGGCRLGDRVPVVLPSAISGSPVPRSTTGKFP